MKRLAIFTFAALSAVAAAEGLELKGLHPGMPVDEAKAALPQLFLYCAPQRTGETGCMAVPKLHGQITLANRDTLGWMILHDGQKVLSVMAKLPTREFESVLAAMTSRWGEPKIDEKEIQNRMGAKFQQTNAYWEKDGLRLDVARRSDKIDEMSVTLLSAESARQLNETQKREAKDASKDL